VAFGQSKDNPTDILGTKVATKMAGTGFGELALMLATSRRQASVVVSTDSRFLSAEGNFIEGCDLIVIDRKCYNRSIGANIDNQSSSLSERITYLRAMPHFIGWTEDHLFEVAYSMKDRTFRAGQKLFRTGERVIGEFLCSGVFEENSDLIMSNIHSHCKGGAYFVRSGEVKLQSGHSRSNRLGGKEANQKCHDIDLELVFPLGIVGDEDIWRERGNYTYEAVASCLTRTFNISKRSYLDNIMVTKRYYMCVVW
jgi:hypothetical protein